MNRNLIAAVLTGVALLALACTTETTVLPSNQEPPGITVSGSGSAFGEPDVAMLVLGVEAEAPSVGAAREQAAGAMNAMVDALTSGGVDDEDIQTTRFSVQPRYDFIDDRQELRGFVVNNLATAKIRSIDDTGSLIDAALEAGGDLARVEGLSFTIDDPSALEDAARRQAVAEARRRAETLAEAGGVSLGRPRTISEAGGPMPIPFEARAADLAQEEAAETPIELGELEVQVSVQVAYELD